MKLKHIIILAFLFIAFFIDFPQIFAARSLDRLADFAHIIIFAVTVIIALNYLSFFKNLSVAGRFLYILLFTFLIGLIIESLQSFSHRTPDIDDILRNVLGASIGFVYWHRSFLKNKAYFKLIISVLLFFVLFEFYFVIRAVADDTRARLNFPVLADLESGFEIDRWEGRAAYEIDDTRSKDGTHSLRVRFIQNTFSDISLIHFQGDWRGYQNLSFSAYNDGQDTLTIFIRIYDINYHEDVIEEKSDRYNDQFILNPGWNTIVIPLEEVLNAPEHRRMNLSHLARIRIFTQFLPTDRLVYLDAFQLN